MVNKRWITYIGAEVPTDQDVRFYEISRQDYLELTKDAQVLDSSSALFLADLFDFFENTVDSVVHAVEYIAVQVYDNVIVPAGKIAASIVDQVVEFGQAAVNIVAELGEGVFETIKALGKTAFNTLVGLGDAVIQTLLKLPTKGLSALADFGSNALNILLDAGVDMVKLTVDLGKKGLKAVRELGSLGIEVLGAMQGAAGDVADFMTNTFSQISPALGKALELTISVAGEAVTFVIDAGKKVGQLVTVIANKVGAAVGSVIRWLAEAFGWDDALKVQRKLADLTNQSLAQAAELLPAVMDEVFVAQWSSLRSSMQHTFAQMTMRPPKSDAASPAAQKAMALLDGLTEIQSLFTEMTSFIPEIDVISIPAGLDANAGGGQDELASALNELLAVAGRADIRSNSVALMQSMNQFFDLLGEAAANPDELPALLYHLLADPLLRSLDAVLDLMEAVFRFLVKAVAAILHWFQDAVNQPINLPGIAGFAEGLIGDDLTVLNLATLLFAVPAALTGQADAILSLPSSALSTPDKSTQDALDIMTGIGKILNGALSLLADQFKQIKQDDMVFVLDATNYVYQFLGLMLSKPGNPDRSMSQISDGAGQFLSTGGEVEDFAWLFECGTFTVEILAWLIREAPSGLSDDSKESLEIANNMLQGGAAIYRFALLIVAPELNRARDSNYKFDPDFIASMLGCYSPILSMMKQSKGEADSKKAKARIDQYNRRITRIGAMCSFAEGGLRIGAAAL